MKQIEKEIKEGDVVEYFTTNLTVVVEKGTPDSTRHLAVCCKILNQLTGKKELGINSSTQTGGALLSQIAHHCYVVGNINQPHLRKHFDKEFLSSIGIIN